MSIITAIERQKNNASRVSLFLDGEFAFGLDEFSAALHRLKVGDSIDRQQLQEIVFESEVNSAFDKAIKLLGIRQRSEKEIKTRLKEKDYCLDVIDKAIEKLDKYGYINDRAFAKLFVDSYKKKYGKNYIDMRLRQLGIEGNIRQDTLDYDDKDFAIDCAKKYLKTRKNINRSKLYNYLYNKGYSSFAIESALDLISTEN